MVYQRLAVVLFITLTLSLCVSIDTPRPPDELETEHTPIAIASFMTDSRVVMGITHAEMGGEYLFAEACRHEKKLPFKRVRIPKGDYGVTFSITHYQPGTRPTRSKTETRYDLHDTQGSVVVLVYERTGRAARVAQALATDIRFANLARSVPFVDEHTLFVTIANSAHTQLAFMTKERANADEALVAIVHTSEQAAKFLLMERGSAHLPDPEDLTAVDLTH
jgi:hypothetical protein